MAGKTFELFDLERMSRTPAHEVTLKSNLEVRGSVSYHAELYIYIQSSEELETENISKVYKLCLHLIAEDIETLKKCFRFMMERLIAIKWQQATIHFTAVDR